MACKTALLSFEITKFKQFEYSELEEFNFGPRDANLNEGVQKVVAKVFTKIKECVSKSIDGDFTLARSRIMNMNNFLHIATAFTQSYKQNDDGTQSQSTTTLTVKFYTLKEKGNTIRIMIDIEQMPNSSFDPDKDKCAWVYGFSNKQVQKLKELLNEMFNLNEQIEYLPIIKRGRLATPCYLVSSDDRILEYDFESTLFHAKSDYQDVKIVNSHSLGKVLLLDNLQNLSEADFEYTRTLMDRGFVEYQNKEILILGGGDGGLLWELIKEDPKMVTMAEIDPTVIVACRDYMYPFGECLEYMMAKTHTIVVEDCMETLKKSLQEGKKYDFIFNDLTDLPVTKREESHTAFNQSTGQSDNPWAFIEGIFNLSMACLKEGGRYMNHATGKGNHNALLAYEKFLKESKYEVEFEKRNAFVPSFMEYWVFYTIKKVGLKPEKAGTTSKQ